MTEHTDIEKLLAGARIETTPDQDDRVLAAATTALPRPATPARPLRFRLAAAAVLVAVCLGGLAVEHQRPALVTGKLGLVDVSGPEHNGAVITWNETLNPRPGDDSGIVLSLNRRPLLPRAKAELAFVPAGKSVNTYAIEGGGIWIVERGFPGEDINLVPSGAATYRYWTAEGEPPITTYQPPAPGSEEYDRLPGNPWLSPLKAPLSTFSIDVDTASYANVRRFLTDGALPPPQAVRPEEMVNYFTYDYPQPEGDAPFAVVTEVADCPWAPERRLVHIGLMGKTFPAEEIPPRNLVFLLDVSGSMQSNDKLPLVKSAMKLLAAELRPIDRVAIVTYASNPGVALPPTLGSERHTVVTAINGLSAGGGTNGAGGIQTAYELARRHFDSEAINRVILATDGDFNVGITDRGSLEDLITEERESGIYLTVLGVGTGNLKDSQMEMLADKGNGNYAYLDSILEAQKVLLREAGSTFVTIAKDVKIQVEFNPARVGAYRLLGYENRMLAARDFADDTKDAGEIGAGHTVTALYEITPPEETPTSHGTKYQKEPVRELTGPKDEILTLKLRYKAPTGTKSRLLEFPLTDPGKVRVEEASDDFAFAAAVAAFGMKLRRSPDAGGLSWGLVSEIASGARGEDPHGDRKEFLDLVKKAASLDR